MGQAWSFAGKRIEFRAALPAGKLVVVTPPGREVESELKLARQGEWALPVGDATLKVVRTPHFAGPKLELYSPEHVRLPPSARHVAPSPVPAGSVCATDQAAALAACARCGTFVCARCRGADRTHCATCFEAAHRAAERNAAAMVYFAPVAVFGVMGGLLGALLGAGAGAAAVAVAKRTEHRLLQIAVAVGLYGAAALVYFIAVALLRG